MASIAEVFMAEVLARLKAAPAFDVGAAQIKRSHRTVVTRANSPAIHLIEGAAKPVEDKSCDWRWQMDGTISVFARDDVGSAAADPIVVEVINRVNPEAVDPIVPYSNGVRFELLEIVPETEIADEDAVRIDIRFQVKFGTARWTLDVPVS